MSAPLPRGASLPRRLPAARSALVARVAEGWAARWGSCSRAPRRGRSAAGGRPASRNAGRPARAARAAPCTCTHASFRRVVQTGQTRNAGSTGARQTGHSRPCRRRAAPRSLGSRARARAPRRGTRADGRACRRARPTNGGTRPSRVASATSHGCSMRRRASLNVQKPIASQKTTPKAIRRARVNDHVREAKKSLSEKIRHGARSATEAVCRLCTLP